MTAAVLPKHVQQLLHQVVDNNGFKKLRIETLGGINDGDNYLGLVSRVILHDDRENGKEEISLILKCAPKNPKRREILRTKYFFERETFMYESAFPELLRAFKERGLVSKTQEALPSTAKCYKTHLSEDGSEDTIVLKNMTTEGFEMQDRFDGLDVEHCRLAVREMAKFHAASIVLKNHDPEAFKRLVTSAPEIVFVPEWESAFKGFADRARTMIDARFPKGTPERAKFDAFADNYYQIMREVIEPDPRLAAFCHADTWTNNILFKYGKNSSVPEEVCFIDFQLSRYATPVTDLAYLIFCSTTKALRDKHFKQLLKDYHQFLCNFLKESGFPDDIVSWEVMQDLYCKYMKFGMGMSFITIPIITSKAGDLHSNEETGDASQLDEIFVSKADSNPLRDERLSDVFHDMIQYGYI